MTTQKELHSLNIGFRLSIGPDCPKSSEGRVEFLIYWTTSDIFHALHFPDSEKIYTAKIDTSRRKGKDGAVKNGIFTYLRDDLTWQRRQDH